MELPEALDFVGRHRRGVLVTLRGDGRPQSSNVAYHLNHDGTVAISVTASRAKTANLRRDPRAVLHVSSDDFQRYVALDSTAALSPVAAHSADPTVEALVALYRQLAGEHRDWDEFRQAMVAERRLLVTLRPERGAGLV